MSRKYVVALLDISEENKVLQSILQFLYPVSFHNLFTEVFPSSSKDSKRNPLLGGIQMSPSLPGTQEVLDLSPAQYQLSMVARVCSTWDMQVEGSSSSTT